MTPTVPELLLGNLIALSEPPPPESMGEYLAAKAGVTGMISVLCAQEAETAVATRVWENAAMRAFLGLSGEDKDLSIAATDRENFTLRKALIDFHAKAETENNSALCKQIIAFYLESAKRRSIELPPMPAS